jgi:uncharacterized protein YcgI (DUF1989 family)
MSETLVRELVIPRCEGRAFEVLKGQLFRVIAIEGKQVGDMTLLNLHDFKERFNAPISCSMNGRTFRRVKNLYSGPPYFNLMLTTVEDKHGVHWVHGRCNRRMYERLGITNLRNCHDNIVEALRPYGIPEHEVPFDTMNIFMVVDVDSEGRYTFRPPLIEKGDYIEYRAEMDVLVAISACPEVGDVNDNVPKPLKVEIRPLTR